jgi:hypothetical protein
VNPSTANEPLQETLDPHDASTPHDLEADMYIPEPFKEDRIDVEDASPLAT